MAVVAALQREKCCASAFSGDEKKPSICGLIASRHAVVTILKAHRKQVMMRNKSGGICYALSKEMRLGV